MEMVEGNVVSLRPEDHGSMRHLALMLLNGAREAERLLSGIDLGGVELTRLAQEQGEVVQDAAKISNDLRAAVARIERCQALWGELQNL